MTKLKLFCAPTTATTKVSIVLEELALPHIKIPVNIRNKVNLYPDYIKLVPTHKVPALMEDSEVFIESSNITHHLALKHGKLFSEKYSKEILTWLFWETSELSPRFVAYYSSGLNFPDYKDLHEKYLNNIEEACSLLNAGLQGKEYLANEYSIADIGCLPWINYYNNIGKLPFLSKYSNLKAWLERLNNRAAIKKVYEENAKFDWDSKISEEDLRKAINS